MQDYGRYFRVFSKSNQLENEGELATTIVDWHVDICNVGVLLMTVVIYVSPVYHSHSSPLSDGHGVRMVDDGRMVSEML